MKIAFDLLQKQPQRTKEEEKANQKKEISSATPPLPHSYSNIRFHYPAIHSHPSLHLSTAPDDQVKE